MTFPVAVYRAWRWWCAAAAGFCVVAFGLMGWVAAHPELWNRIATPEQIKQLVDNDFAAYYSENPAQSFSLQVWTNNVVSAAAALVLGVTLIGTIFVLLQNAANVGLIGGLMIGSGRADVFFGLISPHGLLELTAVFVAAGVGLRMGWSWVDPGPLPRGRALAAAGREAITVALGLVVVLAVSGVIEAFVTPSPLPTWARVGIGVLAEAGFLAYVIGAAGVPPEPARPATSTSACGRTSLPSRDRLAERDVVGRQDGAAGHRAPTAAELRAGRPPSAPGRRRRPRARTCPGRVDDLDAAPAQQAR